MVRLTLTAKAEVIAALEEQRRVGGYGSDGETIRQALMLLKAVHQHSAEGFTQIIVRNPTTHDERILLFGKSKPRFAP